ncbi:HNH endonuclease [Eubacterium ruminantium]|uniref:HNH endonuclease n=1 Tax=Eubacterium ruminantium TaxID=42322 RepID=A0A1T4P2C2_9FIRM|nr:RNA-guided endonuclease IscB [Eubacterium ruminantium]SCW57142.1 HNH endonuclease [Eubacterium ruminantium]SDN08054.1 HNH endonuclease [Eubacterium ruminantium]SJZ85571.1 HNH endonuclease [Eubacterium ruminantium]
MVYIIDQYGRPLMPTERYGKVRRLLKNSKAKVIKRCPFTIQLMYDSTAYTQDIMLGIDAGSKHIGVSATTADKELYAADIELRNDIVELLSTRRESRRTRRNRKTRYRKPRFNNRKRGDSWLAPSVRAKVNTHLKVVSDIYKFLPISKIIVEVASFDIQKIKHPDISGTEYQQGKQLGFWNVREYVLYRDNHTCQCCKGKSNDKVLNVHHIESRKTGGDAPNNLVTLCETCHKGYHNGTVKLPKTIKRGMSFRDATFMGVMRWAFYNRLKELYPDVKLTYGYITKNTRIENNLSKEHYVDVRCISGNPLAEPLGYVYYQKKVRCHNRQIHKYKINKGGVRKRNQADYLVKGFRLFDKVKYNNKEYFIFGRRTSGFFDIRDLQGNKVNKGSISCKRLKYLYTPNTYLTERRFTGSA